MQQVEAGDNSDIDMLIIVINDFGIKNRYRNIKAIYSVQCDLQRPFEITPLMAVG